MSGKKQTTAITFVFITLLIDFTGFGVIIPVLPKLIQELTGGDISVASRYGGWLTFAYAIMQFICSPIVGGLSDRYGRRPILLASLFGLGIDYVFLSFAPTISWLFVGRLIAGITGASFTTGGAYIADISTDENRAQNFGLIGAAFGLGFILGPVIGGVFSQFGSRAPFLVAAGLSLLNGISGIFLLPESLKPENRREFSWKRANPIGTLFQIRNYRSIIGLFWTMFFIYIAGHALQSTWTFFTIEKFQWNEQLIGYSLGAAGLGMAIVQGGLMRFIVPKLGQKNAVYVGLTLYIVGFLCFAFATKSWMMFAILLPYALAGIAPASLQGLIAGQVPPNAQGELQGAMAGIMSVSLIIGPLLMTNLFSYFTTAGAPVYFPGAPFIMGAVLILASIFIATRALGKAVDSSAVPVTMQVVE